MWILLFEHGFPCLSTASGRFDNGFKQLCTYVYVTIQDSNFFILIKVNNEQVSWWISDNHIIIQTWGTHFGETKLVTSISGSPARDSLLTSSIFVCTGTSSWERVDNIKWARSWENLFMLYVNNKDTDQPAHPCSISTFNVHCLDSLISLVSISFGWLCRGLTSQSTIFQSCRDGSFYIQNFKLLASFCGCAGWFEPYVVENPKDRFSCDEAQVQNEPRREKTCFYHMRTTKVQISLRIRAVWSAPLLFTA